MLDFGADSSNPTQAETGKLFTGHQAANGYGTKFMAGKGEDWVAQDTMGLTLDCAYYYQAMGHLYLFTI